MLFELMKSGQQKCSTIKLQSRIKLLSH